MVINHISRFAVTYMPGSTCRLRFFYFFLVFVVMLAERYPRSGEC